MSESKREKWSASFKVDGSIVQGHPLLRWKHIARAKAYEIHWLDKSRQWRVIDLLEGDEIVPDADGFLEYIERYSGPMGPNGTW